MSDAATQKIYTGVPTREIPQWRRLMLNTGAASVVAVPDPKSDTATIIATLEPGRTDFKSVGEYVADVEAAAAA